MNQKKSDEAPQLDQPTKKGDYAQRYPYVTNPKTPFRAIGLFADAR